MRGGAGRGRHTPSHRASERASERERERERERDTHTRDGRTDGASTARGPCSSVVRSTHDGYELVRPWPHMAGEIPMDFGMCVPIDHPSHPQLDHTPQRPLRCFVSRACCRGPASRADRARSIVTGATGNVRVPCRANILIGNRCAAATAEAADPDRGPAPGPAARSRSFLLSFARASTSREVAVTGRHSVLMGERW